MVIYLIVPLTDYNKGLPASVFSITALSTVYIIGETKSEDIKAEQVSNPSLLNILEVGYDFHFRS